MYAYFADPDRFGPVVRHGCRIEHGGDGIGRRVVGFRRVDLDRDAVVLDEVLGGRRRARTLRRARRRTVSQGPSSGTNRRSRSSRRSLHDLVCYHSISPSMFPRCCARRCHGASWRNGFDFRALAVHGGVPFGEQVGQPVLGDLTCHVSFQPSVPTGLARVGYVRLVGAVRAGGG